MAFLPTTREEMLAQGYEQVDFVYVLGDAYVDHPSFGAAIITRTLQAFGYFCNSACHVWDFWYQRAILIPWLIIIR